MTLLLHKQLNGWPFNTHPFLRLLICSLIPPSYPSIPWSNAPLSHTCSSFILCLSFHPFIHLSIHSHPFVHPFIDSSVPPINHHQSIPPLTTQPFNWSINPSFISHPTKYSSLHPAFPLFVNPKGPWPQLCSLIIPRCEADCRPSAQLFVSLLSFTTIHQLSCLGLDFSAEKHDKYTKLWVNLSNKH